MSDIYTFAAIELLQQHDSSKLLLEWWRHHVLLQSDHANAKPGYDKIAHYYAIHITASQFLDKPRDASTSLMWSCNCKFVAISRHISETVQASAKVTTECECEAIFDLSNGVMCNNWVTANPGFELTKLIKNEYLKNGAL